MVRGAGAGLSGAGALLGADRDPLSVSQRPGFRAGSAGLAQRRLSELPDYRLGLAPPTTSGCWKKCSSRMGTPLRHVERRVRIWSFPWSGPSFRLELTADFDAHSRPSVRLFRRYLKKAGSFERE
ncbi:MAG: hypothetical protein ACLSHC_03975 [Bilophila wadsworthia]